VSNTRERAKLILDALASSPGRSDWLGSGRITGVTDVMAAHAGG
jgi:hypothetical protein